jgi:gliding motility-associated protein GldM
MSIPKEPRQIMINLMYLVLTAMLALNISSEILHAFKTINQSITQSNASISGKNNELYQAFQDNENQPAKHDRVKPYNDRAKQIKAEAQKMIAYLESWKDRIIAESGGYTDDKDGEKEIKAEGNIDASTLLLVERKGGDSLKQKLLDFRTTILNAIDPAAKSKIDKQLPVKVENPKKSDNNPQADWSTGNFHNMPVMACVALMSKFQNDVRNSEALAVQELFAEAHQSEIKFDEIAAIGVPKTSYVLAGQKVEASIMMVAYNKAAQLQVSPGGGHISKIQDGIAQWETIASGVGLQTVRGSVTVDLGDRKETKNYQFEYMVGSTGASMQLDKMNVFYIGVPNPITVSAAGYSLEDVSVAIPNATITPGTEKGKYNIMVTNPGEVEAAIMAKTQEAGVKKVGGQKVRIKFIPDPEAQVAGKNSGLVASSTFRVQSGVIAVLKNFDFDARFIVQSFQFSMLPKRGELIGPYMCNSARFNSNAQVQAAIERCKPGDKIFIEEIKAKGPDGKNRPLNSITLTLN